jgi:hypothetical protein
MIAEYEVTAEMAAKEQHEMEKKLNRQKARQKGHNG